MQMILSLESIFTNPIIWLLFVMGAVVGSFLNVCILRLPEGTFFKQARSHCDHCGKLIPFYLNIPILSWFLLRGKSRCCHRPLSIQYPLIEVVTALMFVGIYLLFPFKIEGAQRIVLDPAQFIRFTHFLLFCCVMLVCSVIDLYHQIIPDVLSLPMIALSPLVAAIHPELTLMSSVIGALLGGGILYAVAWLYYLVRREYGLGMGDVKLLAAIGGWLGWQAILPTILMASVLGAVVGIFLILLTKKATLTTAIPFGPFLVLGSILHFVYGRQLSQLLLSI
jgi:leader peptidase (prepilin peptidase)/N-methyltransferase